MNKNIAQRKAIEKKNRERLLKVNPTLNNQSGIYFLTRENEDGIKFCYVGQALHLTDRLLSHMTGFQHIDLSLKAHGLYDVNNNPYGWKIGFLNYPADELNKWERHYITAYAKNGYQMRNKDTGGGEGKQQIAEYRPQKGYRDGLQQGYKNASRDVARLFEKHLDFKPKSEKPNKNQEKAIEKFREFLEFYKGEKDD